MDRNHFSNLSFPCPREALNEIWATLAQRHQKWSCLKFRTFSPYKCIRKQTTSRSRWYMQRFSHKSSSVLEETIFLKFFPPYKCTEKQTWPCRKKVKCQCTTIILAIMVDPPFPMIYAKIQPQGIRRFLTFFTIYGHGRYLGQRTATILAIFRSPNLRRLHMKFEQHWPRGSREVVWNSEHFSHTNAQGSKFDLAVKGQM